MAEIINLAGTTSHSFTIGEDGVTTYHGNIVPSLSIGKPGDIYIQDTTEIEDEHGEGTGVFRPYGKVFMKLVVDGVAKWEPIKNYSFDTPIIKDEETEDESNNYKISLQSAKAPSSATTSTKANDYEKNHDNFGVTRYGTNAEVVASDITNYQTYSSTNLPTNFDTNGQKFMDKNIALTPKQVADNIKVEMKRAITVEGTLNSLNNDLTKTDLVTAINSENTRAKGIEGALTDLNFYNDTSWTGDKNLVTAINFENTRAKGVEGTLSDLTTDDKSSLVAAINSEKSRATGVEGGLQDQIDAIVSKSDVVDVVSCYDRGSDTSKTDIVHYNTSTLGDNDVIKVLIDEQHDDATTYYRWDADTSRFEYIGPEGSYYTKGESDTRFVRKEGNFNEEITGVKTFDSNIIRSQALSGNEVASIKLNDTNNKGSIETDGLYSSSKVTNRTKATSTTANKNGYLDVIVSDTGVGTLSVGGSVTSWSNNTASSSTTSNDVALIGWVNDPSKSTNVVHRSGNETIAGTKTFSTTPVVGTLEQSNNSTSAASTAYVRTAISTEDALVVHLTGDETIAGTKTFTGTIAATGATVNVKTQTQGDNSTKAASTAYVDTGLSTKQPTITFTSSDAKKCYAVNQAGTALEWREVKDITTVDGLEDTVIANKENDQSLVWDTSAASGAGAWVNKRPMVATISYW